MYELANFIGLEYNSDNVTNLGEIVESEELNLYHDQYENYFDGMLVYDRDEKEFHIHINTDKGNYPGSKRERFTLAHELGHFFINEHRIGLKEGYLNPHPSNFELRRNQQIEKEADCFAGSLLMPVSLFREFTKGKKFSLDLIKDISASFQTSILSSSLRFAEIGNHEIMVVFSKDNIVKWYRKSDDFPNMPFRFKVGQKLPPTSVAGEFFTKEDSKYTGMEKVSVQDWFFDNYNNYNMPMYEQCFYSDVYDYVISYIWFD